MPMMNALRVRSLRLWKIHLTAMSQRDVRETELHCFACLHDHGDVVQCTWLDRWGHRCGCDCAVRRYIGKGSQPWKSRRRKWKGASA